MKPLSVAAAGDEGIERIEMKVHEEIALRSKCRQAYDNALASGADRAEPFLFLLPHCIDCQKEFGNEWEAALHRRDTRHTHAVMGLDGQMLNHICAFLQEPNGETFADYQGKRLSTDEARKHCYESFVGGPASPYKWVISGHEKELARCAARG